MYIEFQYLILNYTLLKGQCKIKTRQTEMQIRSLLVVEYLHFRDRIIRSPFSGYKRQETHPIGFRNHFAPAV